MKMALIMLVSFIKHFLFVDLWQTSVDGRYDKKNQLSDDKEVYICDMRTLEDYTNLALALGWHDILGLPFRYIYLIFVYRNSKR